MILSNLKKNVVVVGVVEKKYVPKGGTEEKVLYNISVCTETGEAGMIRCTQSVADLIKSEKFKRFTEHEISCSYNDAYDSFVVEGLV